MGRFVRSPLVVIAVLAVTATSACAGGPTGLTDSPGTLATSRDARAAEAVSDEGPAVVATTVPPTTSSTTTSTTTTSTTTTTTTTLPPAPMTLGFAGDTSFTHGLDGRDPFGEITAELSAPDLMVVNLETAVAEADVGTPFPKKYTFKSPPGSVGLLTAAGIDAVSLANNHTLDFGHPALLRTLELLDDGGVARFGAGEDEAAAYTPLVTTVGERTVAFVGFSRVPCSWSASGENTRPEVAWTCDPFVEQANAAVEAAASAAEVVVVMVHWGIELDHCPQPYQHSLAEGWADRGADLVIGGHPHVLQGVERIGDTWLVHSVGNFAFPSARGASARTAMFTFTIDGSPGEETFDLSVTPVRVSSGRPAPATGDDGAAILADLDRWSFGVSFDEGGAAVVDGEAGVCG